MKTRRVIVTGGGPAGLMAAGQAAEAGAETLLIEKMNRTGLKLCITGKGRCNITNVAELSEFISHFGKTGPFLRQAFARFFNTDLMEFLNALGLELVVERGGRVFPASGKAPDVHRALLQWVKRSGVRIRYAAPVDQIRIQDGSVAGIVSKGEEFPCDAVILATGGASYPATGSTGDGYRLAESAGHTVIPVRQALVPLETSGDEAKRMAGLNLRNVNVRMLVNGKKKREAFGEVVFTEFGLTGPAVLTLSGEAVDSLRNGHKVTFSIDLKPALDENKLDARLQRDIDSRGKEQVNSLLRGLAPREMVPVCLDSIGISADRPVCNISAKERKRLGTWLKDFRLEVTGYRPFAEAIITAGGIDTREIDPRTMESRKTKGLFIAGELLDIQAYTGGYNLQAAFSTGWLAGRSAAHSD
ncbi:MAG: NAD(P)/FAD-dependent oxidoreductase [Desulfobacterales bacterium]|nr:NAD(P)/FAD-dependent oxidoreductase [Desulfobacterales bacterium]MDD3082310.1 NAD(P)/FAD-dependent oxidoreductase [Desulfobacterales bacterium]MDD3950983.1 NAD(P)/FAD-dependent oxidoreductase [Desulfobacterales bacterium]